MPGIVRFCRRYSPVATRPVQRLGAFVPEGVVYDGSAILDRFVPVEFGKAHALGGATTTERWLLWRNSWPGRGEGRPIALQDVEHDPGSPAFSLYARARACAED